jgi:hypothetical protein
MTWAGELILTDKLTKLDWAPVPLQSARMDAAGESVVADLGPTRWRLQVETERLSLTEARRWSAWINRRGFRKYTFTAWRLFRINPLGALGTADGAITIDVNAADNEITLDGVGAYVASVGDMISWRTPTNGFCAVEVMADASASAGAVTLSVFPKPLPANDTPAVRRVQALAEFELTTNPDPFEDYTGRTLSFEAQQVYRQ